MFFMNSINETHSEWNIPCLLIVHTFPIAYSLERLLRRTRDTFVLFAHYFHRTVRTMRSFSYICDLYLTARNCSAFLLDCMCICVCATNGVNTSRYLLIVELYLIVRYEYWYRIFSYHTHHFFFFSEKRDNVYVFFMSATIMLYRYYFSLLCVLSYCTMTEIWKQFVTS